MKIHSAKFLKSAVIPKDYPQGILPEIAFVGRSNVGKSSLINALCRQKALAKTSRTPGKTRLINFFLVNDSFRVADLPGYGYAQVSGEMRHSWKKMVEDYFAFRKGLKGVVLLIDARRGPQDEEIRMIDFLAARELPAQIVLTKADKLNQSARAGLEARLSREFGLARSDYIFTSVKENRGIADLLKRLAAWI